MTLRVERSDNDGRDLSGVFVRAESNDGKTLAVTADRGTFLATDDPDTIILRLTNGRLAHDAPSYKTPRVLSFESHDLPIDLPTIETFRRRGDGNAERSEEHTSELQSLMRNSYAVFCLKKKTNEPK